MGWWLSRFPGSNPEAPVLSRFPGYVPPVVPVDINTLASGYAQPITGAAAVSPLLAFQNPNAGLFTRDMQMPAVAIGAGVAPQYAPPPLVALPAASSAIGYTVTFAYGSAAPKFAFSQVVIRPPAPAGIPSSAIGGGARPQYIAPWTTPGIVGIGLFAAGPIGFRGPLHGVLTAQVVNGYSVYLDSAGNPA